MTATVSVSTSAQSPAFDPSGPPPAFDGSRDGGFGTFIIMRSADELEYRREANINVISISISEDHNNHGIICRTKK